MKKLIASVVDRETKKLQIIERECYETKKAFREDLLANGYSVRFIATEETFDEECEKYHERVNRQVRINKMLWESDKKHAAQMNMSVKEYREWLKG